MYGPALLRIAILAAVAVIAALSPSAYGYIFTIDGWLWRGVRDIVGPHARWLPIGVFAAAILADCIGGWCPAGHARVVRPWLWVLVLMIASAVLFWFLRVGRWFGDYAGFDGAPIPPLGLETAEPLGAILSTYVRMLGSWFGLKDSTAVGIETIAYGSTAVAAMFLWARYVTPAWPWVFAMLVSSGYIVLFFGYPEKGTPKSVALVCWYVYFATRALQEKGTAPLVWSSAILSVAGLMHGSALCWLPAHVWYLWRRAAWRQVVAGVAAFMVPFALLGVFIIIVRPILWSVWGNVSAPLQWFKEYCVTNCGYDFWSLDHLLDIVNCLLALSPMALLCLPEALVRARDSTGRWLVLGALGWLFLNATWFPVFGYLPDWDIFAGAPLVLSYLAIYVGLQVMPERRFRRLALAWIVLSGLHAASWWRFYQLDL